LKHDVEGNRRTENLVSIDKLYKRVGYSLIYRQIIKPDENEQAQNLITRRVIYDLLKHAVLICIHPHLD
jgi:hypothetical protein